MNGGIPVSRTFFSIESEGKRIGYPHLFIETDTCYVRDYCYLCNFHKNKIDGSHWVNNNEPDSLNAQGIVNIAEHYGTTNLVFGCGEFIIQQEFKEVFNILYEQGYWITIETSGQFDMEYFQKPNVLMHLVANSRTKEKYLEQLRPEDQVKVVINTTKDMQLLLRIASMNIVPDIFAVPVPVDKWPGAKHETISESEVMKYVLKHGINCRVVIPQHMYLKDIE